MTTMSTKSSKHATVSDALVQQIDLTTLKFKPRIPKTSDPKSLDEVHCYVCFQFHKLHASGIDKKFPYPDKGLDILSCYGCGLTVHHYCYGLKTPYNEFREHSKEAIKMFVCDKCHETGPSVLRECLVCLQKGGALKKVSNDGYAHITCALFSEMYCIEDFEKMSIRPCSKLEKRPTKQGNACGHCSKGTNLMKCGDPDCELSTHIYCMLKSATQALPESEENKSGWSFKLTSEENPTKIVVDLEDPRVQRILEEVQGKLQEVTSKGDSEKMKEEGKSDSGTKGKKRGRKKGNQESSEDAMAAEEDEKMIKELCVDIREKTNNVVKQLPMGGNGKGGNVEVYCETHKALELYCICRKPYEAEREMVACDCCDNWFDYGCLGFSKGEEDKVKALKAYFCKKCRKWRTYVRDFFLKGVEAMENAEQTEMGSSLHCEMVDSLQCIPRDTFKFTAVEYIIICVVLQMKVARKLDTEVIQKEGNIQELMEKFLESAKYIPFNLNGIATSLLQKYFLGYGVDALVEKIVPLSQYESINSIYDPETSTFDNEKTIKLQEQVQQLSALHKIYKECNLEKSSTATKIQNLLDKQNWLLDVCQVFSQEEQKESVSSEKVKEFLSKAERIGIDMQNAERLHLEGLVENISDWSSQIKKAIAEKTGTIRSKITELEGVESQNLPLEKALKALDDIEVICKAALEVRPNAGDLEEIVVKCQGESEMETEENVKGIKGELSKMKDQEKRGRGKKPKVQDELERKTLEVCENLVMPVEGESLVEEYKKGKTMQLKLQYYQKQGVKEGKVEGDKNEEKMEVEDEDEENGEDKKGRRMRGSGKKSKESKTGRKGSKSNVGEHGENQEEEVLMEKSEDGGEIGTVEELEQLVKEAEGVENKFMKDKKAVKEMLGEVMKLRKKIKDSLGGSVTDVKELEAIVKESRKFRIGFKEKEDVKEKCRVYREKVNEVRRRVCSVDELVSVKEEFGKMFKDVRMQGEIKNRMDKAKKLEKEAEKMLNKKTFSREDIEKKVQALVAEMQEQKVKVGHKEDLEGLQRSLAWLESLYRFRKQCMVGEKKGINGHMEVEDEKNGGEGEEDKEKEAEESKKNEEEEEELSVDSLAKACEIKGSEWESLYKKRYEEFKEILKQGQKEKHRDQRIDKVYKEHVKLYCEIEAGLLLEGGKLLDIEDVERVCEIGERLGVEGAGEMYEKLVNAQEGYRKWIQEVEEVVGAEELGSALDEECRGQEGDLVKLREKAKRLVKEYEEIGVEAEEENKVLKSVWRWLEWSGKGREMLKMVKEAQKASLEAIEDFVSYAKDIKISTDNWLYREINKALDELDGLKEEFDETKKTRKVIKKKIRGIYKEFDVNRRKKNLERLCREKPRIEKVMEIDQKVKDSSLYVVQSEVDEMQGEIKKCVAWSEKVAGFMEKYGKDLKKTKEEGWGEFSVKDEEIGKIQKEISGIKSEMRNLVLRDADGEEEIRRFEWFFRCRLLADRKLARGNSVKAWMKLRKMGEKDKKGERRLGETGLFEEIKKEIEKYEEVMKKIEGLRVKENLLMQNWWMTQGNNIEAIKREGVRKEELEGILREIVECKIDLSAEAAHLRELLMTGEEAGNFFKGVTSGEFGEKPNLEVVTNLLKRFYSTIIEYPEEEKVLQEYIKKAEEMWLLLQKFLGRMEKIETVYEKYQECPVHIDEAERLCKEYVRENELGEKVVMMSDEGCGVKEVEKLLEEVKASAVMDFDGKMSEARKRLHRLRIMCLKKVSEKEEIKEEEHVKFEVLKRWRDEANQVISEEKDREEAKEELEWMEKLVQEVKEKVEEVCSVKEVGEIKEEMNVVCGFVDIRKDVVEHKRRLEKAEKKRLEAEAMAAMAAKASEEKKMASVVDMVDVVDVGDEKVMEMEHVEIKEVVEGGEKDKEELLGKRNLEEIDEEGEVDEVEIKSDKEEEDLGTRMHKKVKGDKVAHQKEVRYEHKRKENERREQARKKMMETMSKNKYFEDVRNRMKGIVKRLELKVFLKEGARVRQYEKLMDEVCWLLGFLDCNQGFSKNLVEKDFDLEYIEELISKFSTAKSKRSKKDNVRKHVEIPAEKKQEVVKNREPETVIEEEDIVIESVPVQTQEIKDEGTISVSSHASFVETAPKKKEMKAEVEALEEEDDEEEGEDIEEEEDEEDLEEEDEDEEDYDEDEDEDEEAEVVNLESEEDEAHKKQLQPQSHVSSHPLTQIVPEIEKHAEENLPVYENGSILMIYEGKINSTELLNRSVSLTASSGVRMCSLYTCEDCSFVRKFPKLPKELSIVGKSAQKDALDYIEELHKGWITTPGKEKPYIVGWIEAKRDVQADIARLGEDLLERRKVALLKYSDFAEMYLLHPAMLKKEMAKQLDWKVQTVAGQRKPKTTLLFMINRKHRALIKPFEKIEPEFVGLPEKSIEEKAEDQMEVLEVEDDLVSPLTSLADEEQMLNGQGFGGMQFGNMGNMNNMMMAMGGQGMLEQFMAASMLGGQMGQMGYNPELMSMMAGFGQQGPRGVNVMNSGNKWTGRGDKKRGQNVIVDDEEEEGEDEEEDEDEDEEEEDEEDLEDEEDDEDEDGEDEEEEMGEEEYKRYVQMQEILKNKLEEKKKEEKKKEEKRKEPQVIEEIESDEEEVQEEEDEEDDEDEIEDEEDEDEVEEIEDDEEEIKGMSNLNTQILTQYNKQKKVLDIIDDDEEEDEAMEIMEVDDRTPGEGSQVMTQMIVQTEIVSRKSGEVMEMGMIEEIRESGPQQEILEKSGTMEVENEGDVEEQTQELQQTQELRGRNEEEGENEGDEEQRQEGDQ